MCRELSEHVFCMGAIQIARHAQYCVHHLQIALDVTREDLVAQGGEEGRVLALFLDPGDFFGKDREVRLVIPLSSPP